MSPEAKTPKPRKQPKRKTAQRRAIKKPRTEPFDAEAYKATITGRPTVWTPEAKAQAKVEILTRMKLGELISTISRDQHMPSVDTVYDWKGEDPSFTEAFTHAQDRCYDARFENLPNLAAARENDMATVELPGGAIKVLPNTIAVSRDRLIVETELKFLALARPKRYGQKLQHVGGDETDAPIRVEAEVKPDRELAKAIASILARSQGTKDDG